MDISRPNIYATKPLHKPRDIRILRIEAAEELSAPLCCNLSIVNLDQDQERYQTLSYAWGARTADCSIMCDGCVLLVTRNLDQALRRIREKISPKDVFSDRIWIDAICINQDDIAEKGGQVSMMGDIYANSERLIIWLGEAESLDISDLRAALRGYTVPDSRTMVALTNVLRRGWFKRRWVIQEVIKHTANERYALIGDYRCRCESVMYALRQLYDRHDWTLPHAPHISAKTTDNGPPAADRYRQKLFAWEDSNLPEKHLQETIVSCPVIKGCIQEGNIREDLLNDKSRTILENLYEYERADCSSAHDRIYALLGISKDTEGISVDYTIGMAELYVTFAERYMGTLRDAISMLSIASARHDKRYPNEDFRLPTWAPNWNVEEKFVSRDHRNAVDLTRSSAYIDLYDAEIPSIVSTAEPRFRHISALDPVIRECTRTGPLKSRHALLTLRGWLITLNGHIMSNNDAEMAEALPQRSKPTPKLIPYVPSDLHGHDLVLLYPKYSAIVFALKLHSKQQNAVCFSIQSCFILGDPKPPGDPRDSLCNIIYRTVRNLEQYRLSQVHIV